MFDHEALNALIRVYTGKAAEHECQAQVALRAGLPATYLMHLEIVKGINRQVEEFRLRIVLLNNSAKKVLQTAG